MALEYDWLSGESVYSADASRWLAGVLGANAWGVSLIIGDGTTWVCAISTLGPVPVDPAEVAPDAGAHARLEAMCRTLSPALAAAPIKTRQACFRPVTADGLPLIGAVPGVEDVYVATGHSVWGMLNAPATGEAMSELILTGAARCVDLAPFAPGRLPALDPARLRGASG